MYGYYFTMGVHVYCIDWTCIDNGKMAYEISDMIAIGVFNQMCEYLMLWLIVWVSVGVFAYVWDIWLCSVSGWCRKQISIF